MPNDNQVNQAEQPEIYENKAMLKNLLVKWKDIIEPDKSVLRDDRLCKMIRDVKEYANMKHTVAYAKEGKLYNKILKAPASGKAENYIQSAPSFPLVMKPFPYNKQFSPPLLKASDWAVQRHR